MELSAIDFNPYTFNAISLIIVGLASIVYVGNLKEKDGSIRSILIGLSFFTLCMVTMAASNFSYRFVAFGIFTDAFSVMSMSAMTDFVYRYPGKIKTVESRVFRSISLLLSLLAVCMALYTATQVFTFGHTQYSLPGYYGYLNPISFLMSLVLSIRQSIRMQPERPRGIAAAVKAFIKPVNRPALFMRNLSLAISIGLVQGFVSAFGTSDPLSVVSAALLINGSLLIMLAAIVYASFDFTYQQPSLVIRLAGISLVSTLAVLGVIGTLMIEMSTRWVVRQNRQVIADTLQSVAQSNLNDIETEVNFLFSYPTGDETRARLEYARDTVSFDNQMLAEFSRPATVPIWSRYTTTSILSAADTAPGAKGVGRYGHYSDRSTFEYAAYLFDWNGRTYEIWMDLDEVNEIIQIQSIGILAAILVDALFIIIFFPMFFRSNLIRPLERLLAAVRQADGGNLAVQAPVTHHDEVGYLTTAFNRMIVSLKQELDGRQAAENELRQFNLTLEERVAKRTRELEILYQLTAASNTAGDSQNLYTLLLERTIAALQASGGFFLLTTELEDTRNLHLVSASRLEPDWSKELHYLPAETPWLSGVLKSQEPILIPNTSSDPQAPDFLHRADPQVLLLSALHGEGLPLGVLGILRPIDRNFDLEELTLAVSIINQFGVVIHNDRLRQRLQQASMLEERQRLSRDLHDSVTQSLYGLVTLTEVGLMRAEKLNTPAITELFEKIGQSTRQSIREMRLFIHQLRPPELEQEGLINALDLRLAAVEGRSDVKARLIADESIHLPLPVETACYHIAQEALNNSLKHAHAANVTVSISRTANGVKMEIADDGPGFDLMQIDPGGMGLENMRSRAAEIGAEITIDSTPGQGTTITVQVEGNP
jgi:signal transduction histidine kinase